MKQSNFSVGPTQLFPTVPNHIQTAIDSGILSKSHRSTAFEELYIEITSNLRKLLTIPQTHRIYFVSSGTECMERVIQNTVIANSFHFVNGSFSDRFYETSVELGKNAQKIESAWGESFNFPKVKIPLKAELICFTHNETSTGVMLNLEEVYKVKKNYPQKLTALDVVSSIPYANVDYSKVDLVFFSVQKGFGLPAGLGIMVISPQAFEKFQSMSKKGISTGSYHSFKELEKYAIKNQTPETPNVFDMYLLAKVSGDMIKIGIDSIRQDIEEKSKRLEDYFDKSEYSYLVTQKSIRSKTIHVIKVPEGSKAFVQNLKQKGIVVSTGYKDLKESHVRISNFPAHSVEEIKKLLKSL